MIIGQEEFRMQRSAMLVVILFLVFTCPLCSKTLYVRLTGSDSNSGLSWDSAKKTVQACLNAAVMDDEVWVAAGTYVECIKLKTGVRLYGGFSGSETARDQRNWRTNETILDGNRQKIVVSYTYGSIINTTTIDGFTIRNGRFVSEGYAGGAGGIYSNACINIRNNIIRDNWGIGIETKGGTIANNLIIGNNGTPGTDQSGGGVMAMNVTSLTMINNTITGNSGNYITYCWCSGPAVIANNTITGNYGYYSAINFTGTGPITVKNNIVAFNSSGVQGIPAATITYGSNCVYGNTNFNYQSSDPTGANGNISADPELLNWQYGRTHIQPDSPCRNTGDNSIVEASWKDMDDQSRIDSGVVDMGADESNGATWNFTPSTIFLSPNGDDANDGLSWASAKKTAQAAIDKAAVQGGEIWAAAGTYTGFVTLRPFVHIYGGFNGTETARDQRNWPQNRSVLDGNRAGTTVTAGGGSISAVIDGFTICNGSDYGIYAKTTPLTLSHNLIMANGNAGIYLTNSNSTVMDNLIYINQGEGIRCDSPVVIANNTIVGQQSSGIRVDSNISPLIGNNIIAYNGIGLYKGNSYATPVIENNCVYGNKTNYYLFTDQTGLNGNISVDPMFAGLNCGDLHIQPTSPCRNIGKDSLVVDSVDIDMQARIQGTHVDMGRMNQMAVPELLYGMASSALAQTVPTTMTARPGQRQSGQYKPP